LRFFIDPESGQPHIFDHGVSEEEVRQVLLNPGEARRGSGNSQIALGQTTTGRYLRVVCSPDEIGEGIFVITAFDLRGQAAQRLPPSATEKATMKKQTGKNQTRANASKGPRKIKQRFPPGWDETRVRAVIAHYENQTEDEAVAEDEAATHAADHTLMSVPIKLVPAVLKLIASQQKTI